MNYNLKSAIIRTFLVAIIFGGISYYDYNYLKPKWTWFFVCLPLAIYYIQAYRNKDSNQS